MLSEINFSISKGDRILLLGPNGSGKSTIGLLAAGILKPSSGIVCLTNNNRQQIRVGIVFQNSRMQMVGTTVEEDLAFSLSTLNYPLQKIKSLVNHYLELFDLTHKKNFTADQLSGGELHRLALASVLITEPDLLILDEPLTMLDQHNQEVFLEYLEHLVLNELAILWLDHDLRNIRYSKSWLLLTREGHLKMLSEKELKSIDFLKEHHIEPAPLQYLEWKYPDLINHSISGPGRIEIKK